MNVHALNGLGMHEEPSLIWAFVCSSWQLNICIPKTLANLINLTEFVTLPVQDERDLYVIIIGNISNPGECILSMVLCSGWLCMTSRSILRWMWFIDCSCIYLYVTLASSFLDSHVMVCKSKVLIHRMWWENPFTTNETDLVESSWSLATQW